MTTTIDIERIYNAAPERIWDLWTTAAGIESWWAPDGFEVRVDELDLRPGGELRYVMTATGPDQVAFMNSVGLPLSTSSRKYFTAIENEALLAYDTVVDFVPGRAEYRHRTTVTLTPFSSGTRVVMTIEPMHDDEWTERIVAGRGNELDNLGVALSSDGRV
ncbi:SRPBCC family protein [Smaragdicoccus niigatensis]|uniref:SRPBCC family protein n=1 Tax=Smaragdicoccus niigatensis TaxID=359359 RepID=UPI00035C84E7|nr:SRPBCC domain-containing protein [Smaragdicoccus niigatensis]